jgi:hypothetical protein
MKKEMAKKSKNKVIMKMVEKNLAYCQKVGLFGNMWNVSL